MKRTLVLCLILLISLSVFASGAGAQTNVNSNDDLIEVEFQDEGTLNVEGWEHTTDSFKFPCDGAADMAHTPCYGKADPQSGNLLAPGPYTLISRTYECKTPEYETNVCDGYSGMCTFNYEGQESTESVDTLGGIDNWAKLVKGNLDIKYTCHQCGYGSYVWSVTPTNCSIDIYTKSFSSCDDLCQSTIQGAIGQEEGKGEETECKCYCEKGAEPILQSNDLWTCTTGEDPYIPFGEEIYVSGCIDAPELCVLPNDIRDRMINWFYGVIMKELNANFLHTWTYKDAEGDWHLNWGMPFGWTQRFGINIYKRFAQTKVYPEDKWGNFDSWGIWGKPVDWGQTGLVYLWKTLTNPDLSANPNIPKKGKMGTCGDVMAYVDETFRKDFPGVEITTVAMAWEGWIFNHDHAANIVLPINPATGKQYKQNEVPSDIFEAETSEDLPEEWQNAVVLDGWAKRVVSFKEWFDEYKHGDGEVSVGDYK